MSDKKYGYFSPMHKKSCGTYVYTTPSGKTVHVTCVGESKDPKSDDYMWDDARCIGEVVEFVRRVPGPGPFQSDVHTGSF